MKIKQDGKRILVTIIGIVLVGLSAGVFRKTGFGTDPYTCMNLGLSGFFGMDFGTFQLLVNIVLLLMMLLFSRHFIGFGTFVNMIFMGYISDFSLSMLDRLLGPVLSLGFRLTLLFIAVIVICIGAALYMEANLGIAPYDAMGYLLERIEKRRLSYRYNRIITDVVAVAIGFSFGSVVGIGTVILSFFTGPLITFFRDHFASKVMGSPLTGKVSAL